MMRAAMPYLVAIVAVFGVLFCAYQFGAHVEHNARLAEVASINAQHATELAKAHQERADAEQRARDIEAQRAADMAALDAQHTKEMSDARQAAERTIADLRAGTVRLRERFTCPASSTAGAGAQAGTSTGLGDAATRYGLQPEDAGFLLSEAQRADEVTVQLRACQAIVQGDRK
ncbi:MULTISPECIES: lysis system i-spanin subunit Rz [Enterobacteriaceae]|uniref:lysis system i-spanin subunit Rz n=2 Tax=Enterobacterales TaxID=91347 RepID=UPI001FF17E1F|nr:MULTISPECIES: lysis system i-spanin subunit Rz [Enterobacteriaceae]MDT9046447.1 lysis system i-spanin subunit Rz [Escherichia coli]UOV84350.1 lysis protein [Klebsiella pneumoniae]